MYRPKCNHLGSTNPDPAPASAQFIESGGKYSHFYSMAFVCRTNRTGALLQHGIRVSNQSCGGGAAVALWKEYEKLVTRRFAVCAAAAGLPVEQSVTILDLEGLVRTRVYTSV
eukprot:1191230-Prorocentrum_minimum.AAC.3